MFKNKNIIVLNQIAVSGSFFIQGLFDGHEEVLVFPSYCKAYDYLLSHVTAEEVVECFIKSNSGFFESNCNPFVGGEYSLDVQRFKKNCLRIIGKNFDQLSRKDIFLIFGQAYCDLINKDFGKIKYILIHLHHLDNIVMEDFPCVSLDTLYDFIKYPHKFFEERFKIIQDFPTAKFIFSCRDFRESMLSFIKMHQRIDYRLIFHYSLGVRAYVNFFNCITQQIKSENFKVIDLNALHITQQRAIREICNWLSIRYREKVFSQSTFLGHKVKYPLGRSANKLESHKFSDRMHTLAFSTFFSKQLIKIIEYLHYDLLLGLQYMALLTK